jgi:hypothetical protein
MPRTPVSRPLSEATEIFDTDMDSGSDFEDEQVGETGREPVPRASFDSVGLTHTCACHSETLADATTGRQPTKKSNNDFFVRGSSHTKLQLWS